jgi:hypothetical protein
MHERSRLVLWAKDDPYGAEVAEVTLGEGCLSCKGVALGVERTPYRLDYELETSAEFVTTRLVVAVRGDGWRRSLDLRRSESGAWSGADGDLSALEPAFDCDLGLSPMTNTMPVLRHRLLDGAGPVEIVTAWVSVPDLSVTPSRQRYTFRERREELIVVRFELVDGDFAEDIAFDADGLVLHYPRIARRVPLAALGGGPTAERAPRSILTPCPSDSG